jgi:hypothetical protein
MNALNKAHLNVLVTDFSTSLSFHVLMLLPALSFFRSRQLFICTIALDSYMYNLFVQIKFI